MCVSVQGVHYTEKTRPAGHLSRQAGFCKSTAFHALDQLKGDYGALDYAFLSPIYDSISKQGYPAASFDRQQLQSHLLSTSFPVYALGGARICISTAHSSASTASFAVWLGGDIQSRHEWIVACYAGLGAQV